METVTIPYRYDAGSISSVKILKKAIICPHCKTTMIPDYLFMDVDDDIIGQYSVFSRCSNPRCNQSFICEYHRVNYSDGMAFYCIKPTYPLDRHIFSDIINGISPVFCEIYNQAYAAKQMNLTQICGTGYRKALEFLIKDYIISKDPDKEDSIKNKLLGNCIKDDVTDQKIKQVAERAAWLGNDETHYVRKWEDKDINDLVSLIDLTIHWIESEIETKNLLESMPEKK